jgi:hypothetical protein
MVRLGNPKLHYRTHSDELAHKFIERLPDGFYHREKASRELLEGWMAPHATEGGSNSHGVLLLTGGAMAEVPRWAKFHVFESG